MVDAEEMDAPARAVKLLASDWKKLAALALAALLIAGGALWFMANAIVSSKLDDLAATKGDVSALKSDVSDLKLQQALTQKDIETIRSAQTEMKDDVKQVLTDVAKISAALNARGYPVVKATGDSDRKAPGS